MFRFFNTSLKTKILGTFVLIIAAHIAVSAQVTAFDTIVTTDSPVHYWKCDEGASPCVDTGTGAKNLTTVGGGTV